MRYTDQQAAQDLEQDFTLRNRLSTGFMLALIAGLSYTIIMTAYVSVTSSMGFAAIAGVTIIAVNGMLLLDAQRTRDQLLTAEFQNALFSSVLRLNTLFCVIMRKDGSIVYSNDGFNALYPRFMNAANRHLDVFFDMAGISKEDADVFYGGLARGQALQHFATLKDGEGLRHKVVLTMDPLRRPKEFVVMRARLYVEDRKPGGAGHG